MSSVELIVHSYTYIPVDSSIEVADFSVDLMRQVGVLILVVDTHALESLGKVCSRSGFRLKSWFLLLGAALEVFLDVSKLLVCHLLQRKGPKTLKQIRLKTSMSHVLWPVLLIVLTWVMTNHDDLISFLSLHCLGLA